MNQILNWLEKLSGDQIVWTYLLFALCIIGIFRQLYLCIRYWISDPIRVNKFLKQSSLYVDGIFNGTNNNLQAQYIIRKYNSIHLLFGEDRILFPECDIANSITFNNVNTRNKYDDILRKLATTYLEWDEKRRSTRWLMLLQLIFPLIFWLFRGIECIFILLAYLLKELGFKEMSTKGSVVKILTIIFTIITGLASLFSYLHIDIL